MLFSGTTRIPLVQQKIWVLALVPDLKLNKIPIFESGKITFITALGKYFMFQMT